MTNFFLFSFISRHRQTPRGASRAPASGCREEEDRGRGEEEGPGGGRQEGQGGRGEEEGGQAVGGGEEKEAERGKTSEEGRDARRRVPKLVRPIGKFQVPAAAL